MLIQPYRPNVDPVAPADTVWTEPSACPAGRLDNPGRSDDLEADPLPEAPDFQAEPTNAREEDDDDFDDDFDYDFDYQDDEEDDENDFDDDLIENPDVDFDEVIDDEDGDDLGPAFGDDDEDEDDKDKDKDDDEPEADSDD